MEIENLNININIELRILPFISIFEIEYFLQFLLIFFLSKSILKNQNWLLKIINKLQPTKEARAWLPQQLILLLFQIVQMRSLVSQGNILK